MFPNIITRNFNGVNLDGSCPLEGWGLYRVDSHIEIQKIDELDKIQSDDEALKLAKRKGLKFDDPCNPYKLTGYGNSYN